MFCESTDHDGARVIAKHTLNGEYLCGWHYEAALEASGGPSNGLDADANYYLDQLTRQDRDQLWGRMSQDDY